MKTNILILQESDKALKKHYIILNKTSMNSCKNTYKSGFVTCRESVGYKVVSEKVLNWTSKGR